jgi:hypothetical protein
MKRIIASLALAALATLVAVPAVHAQCSDATLTGNYAFTYTAVVAPGRSMKGQNNVPFAAVGVFTFDGAGSLSLTYTLVVNGVVSTTSEPDTGTYTVNSDCTGIITDATIGIHFNLVTVGGGTEFSAIQTDTGFTATTEAKKQ